MKSSQIFNGIFFVNLIAMVVIGIQLFTGYFVDPSIQVAALTIINLIYRLATRKDILTNIKAPIGAPVETTKEWYTSKMFWMSVISFAGALIQSLTGWAIPEEAYLQIVSVISFLISIVTHKPIAIA